MTQVIQVKGVPNPNAMTAPRLREVSMLLLEDANWRLATVKQHQTDADPKMQKVLQQLEKEAQDRKAAAFALQDFSFTFKGEM